MRGAAIGPDGSRRPDQGMEPAWIDACGPMGSGLLAAEPAIFGMGPGSPKRFNFE